MLDVTSGAPSKKQVGWHGFHDTGQAADDGKILIRRGE